MKPGPVLALPLPALLAIAALAMLGLQAAIEYRLLAPMANDAARLGEAIRTLRVGSAPPGPPDSTGTPTATAPDLKQRLDAVLGHLRGSDATAARVERLHRIADQSGVLLRKASYLDEPAPGEVGRHEIQAELAGAYPAIRQFLRELSVQDLALAVESLEFSRQPGAAGVRAQVRMVLYFRRSAP